MPSTDERIATNSGGSTPTYGDSGGGGAAASGDEFDTRSSSDGVRVETRTAGDTPQGDEERERTTTFRPIRVLSIVPWLPGPHYGYPDVRVGRLLKIGG